MKDCTSIADNSTDGALEYSGAAAKLIYDKHGTVNDFSASHQLRVRKDDSYNSHIRYRKNLQAYMIMMIHCGCVQPFATLFHQDANSNWETETGSKPYA